MLEEMAEVAGMRVEETIENLNARIHLVRAAALYGFIFFVQDWRQHFSHAK